MTGPPENNSKANIYGAGTFCSAAAPRAAAPVIIPPERQRLAQDRRAQLPTTTHHVAHVPRHGHAHHTRHERIPGTAQLPADPAATTAASTAAATTNTLQHGVPLINNAHVRTSRRSVIPGHVPRGTRSPCERDAAIERSTSGVQRCSDCNSCKQQPLRAFRADVPSEQQ